ncbi:MAG TPA: aminotransferase class IV [Steroidobacteraceae bacterium]|jgi:D-alanine transaminase|nr:aminotransferase class IV [Steroidobacteraceae bacterium]
MPDPLPVCHLNGSLLPLREARISPLDRSFLFGDGVYEVIAARRGRARRLASHLARLARSLGEVRIRNPYSEQQWRALIEALIEANGSGDLYVYLQVSRGAEYGRNHAPLPELEPTVFAFCSPLPVTSTVTLERGVACITAEDTRWARCDIKSVSLLANVLLRQQSVEADAAETILLRDGWLTDASSSTVYIVVAQQVRAPPNSNRLLPGTTRSLIEELADAHGIERRSTPVSEAQLRSADEVWLSASTRGVLAVTSLDGQPVGNGRPGPMWQRMRGLIESYWAD